MKLVVASYLSRKYARMPYGSAALRTYLASHPDEAGGPVDTSTLAFPHDLPVDAAVERIAALAPDLVAVSCFVWNHVATVDLLGALRRRLPGVAIIVGGPQASPEVPVFEQMGAAGVVDRFVTGSGERVLADIVRGIRRGGGSAARRSAAALPLAMSRWTEGAVDDLDTLPCPYRLDSELLAEVGRTQVAYIEGARGCPFRCTFCDEGWRKVQTRAVELVEDDLAFLYANGARTAIFLDPTFNFDRRRVVRTLRFVRDRLPGLRVSAEIKVDTLGDEEIEALAEIEGTQIEVGLQTSNAETLRRILRPTHLSKLWDNARALAERRVLVGINTIFGLPGERLSDWMATLDYCYRMGDVVIFATCLKVLPNTQVFRERTEYEYEYDEADLFRATRSRDMSRDDFGLAEAMTRLLVRMQPNDTPIPAEVRREIDRRYSGSLAQFLCEAARLPRLPSSLPLPSSFTPW